MDLSNSTLPAQWSSRQPMRIARSHFAAAVCRGKIYVFGGGGAGFQSLNRVEIYDPDRDAWTDGREMPTTRSGVAAVTLNDRIYVMGGGFREADGTFRFLTTVEIYDPSMDCWERGPDLLMRHDAPSATLLEGRIYLLGGHHPDAKGGPLSDPAFSFSERFDASSGHWEQIPPMPTPRFSLVALSWEGRLLALGGGAFTGKAFTNFDRVEAYDPGTGLWSHFLPLTLPWTAAGPAACVFRTQIFLFGGNNGEAIQRRAARYDPVEGKWSEIAPMPEARVTAAALPVGDAVYLIGGRDATGKAPVDSVFSLRIP